jgi:hypothetical protein
MYLTLTKMHMEKPFDAIIEGGAQGADRFAREWAEAHAVKVETYYADWRVGPKAGPIRNQRMLDDGRPDVVVAFAGGRGTADMVRRAMRAGVQVITATT